MFCRSFSFLLILITLQTVFDDNNVPPLSVENAEITCSDYVLTAYDKICYIGKVLENDLSDKTYIYTLLFRVVRLYFYKQYCF